MGKTSAEKQRTYRERMKARLGEEFLKKERERVKKARTPAALLNKKELAVRRKQQNKWQRKCRALKKGSANNTVYGRSARSLEKK